MTNDSNSFRFEFADAYRASLVALSNTIDPGIVFPLFSRILFLMPANSHQNTANSAIISVQSKNSEECIYVTYLITSIICK